ncbi:uncharacterized protein BJ212DRAFT_1348969 [Suillus subaureus]|uniref:Uncharacterized protein n=1 Tax=Suillus subaureus TaxID=48587 RepID=A0A9P7EE18_9AGAM|nr:uncharacterized protein BJ212DRAFT_1348969 [Suillus subaureus]KAG1818135.1 hypothetical protein BJ212DRAFT_1348969 [Suillus subaureus]
MSAAVLAGIVTAQDPTGGSCNQPGQYECGRSASYNGNNAYLYFCLSDNFVTEVKNCNCPQCCYVVGGGLGPNGSKSCT